MPGKAKIAPEDLARLPKTVQREIRAAERATPADKDQIEHFAIRALAATEGANPRVRRNALRRALRMLERR